MRSDQPVIIERNVSHPSAITRITCGMMKAAKMNMTYPVLDGDPQQDQIDDAYGPLFGLPMSFLIARDGRLCRKHLGLPGMQGTREPDAKTVKDIFESEVKALLGDGVH